MPARKRLKADSNQKTLLTMFAATPSSMELDRPTDETVSVIIDPSLYGYFTHVWVGNCKVKEGDGVKR